MEDPYLESLIVEKRLYKEWKEHKGVIIFVDFDNTVYDFYQEGHTHQKVLKLLKECQDLGCTIGVFTCRGEKDYDTIVAYFNLFGITIKYINTSPEPVKHVSLSNKVYYNILLDDRAGLEAAYKALLNVKTKIVGESQHCDDGGDVFRCMNCTKFGG